MSALDQQYLRRRDVEQQLTRMQYDEHGTPSAKMPACPLCEEDDLGAIGRCDERVRVACCRCRFFYDFESPLVKP
jgi:hypothetical protein